jgi:hypothetical protein
MDLQRSDLLAERHNTASLKGKIHRVDPDFGSTLTVSSRDSQSNCWVNLKIMGQPCDFQVLTSGSGPVRPEECPGTSISPMMVTPRALANAFGVDGGVILTTPVLGFDSYFHRNA